jgi:uncharacterized membrane protein
VPWDAVFAYLHLLAAGVSAALKVAEHWLLARPPDRLQVRLLGQARLGYLLAITTVLATGLVRLQGMGGSPVLASGSSLFAVKIALYVLLLLLAVPTTGTIVRWNREAHSPPAFAPRLRELEALRATVSLEIGLLALVPLPAVMLARGAGF